MRIVYLHQYFSTRFGGTRSYEVARRLVAMGHDVQMITANGESPATRSRGWSCAQEDGICVHSLPVPYSNYMDYRRRMRAFAQFAWSASFKAASLKGELVFATSTPLTIALPAVYAARRNQIPMVFEVRDLWPQVPIALGALRGRVTIEAARLLERFAYRNAARVVALSPAIKAGIVAGGYPEDRIAMVPNACDIHLFDVGPGPGLTLRQQHPWLRDRPLIIYTGALGRANGVTYLTQVAAAAERIDPQVCFLVIGDGKEKGQVRHTAEQLGVLDRNFFLMPEVPKVEIARWLSAADIATSLFIDLRELWGNSANKVFDALAAGKPVAINYGGWQADLFRETGAGLVLDARDWESAASRLVAAVRNKEWLARAGAAARRLARERFDRDRLTEQLERVLRAAVEEQRAAASVAVR
jgi:glycosyltransferase involved in cell wall biosynthesis